MFHIKRYFGKLNKKQADEIGTLKSPTKPLYQAKQHKEELISRKKELESFKNYKYEIEEEIKGKQKELEKEEELLIALQEMNEIEQELKIEEEKVNLYKKTKEELEKNKEELDEELKRIEPIEKYKKSHKIIYIIPAMLIILSIILFTLDKLFGIAEAIFSVILFIIIFLINSSRNKRYKKEEYQRKGKVGTIEAKIELIDEEINSKSKLIQETEDKIHTELNLKKEEVRLKYPSISKTIFDSLENGINFAREQNYINELKLNLSQKNLEKGQVIEKLEALVEIEEKIDIVEETLRELIAYNDAIEISKEALEIAYLKMKDSITPKFTENLSTSIGCITDNKYKTVKVTEENNLVLETKNGNYIEAESLSQGTIDELYLSLRISSINELVAENMPIILDETFAYFDNNRLENVLKFFNRFYKNKQIIILTCTEREIDLLDKANIEYNKIVLDNYNS